MLLQDLHKKTYTLGEITFCKPIICIFAIISHIYKVILHSIIKRVIMHTYTYSPYSVKPENFRLYIYMTHDLLKSEYVYQTFKFTFNIIIRRHFEIIGETYCFNNKEIVS